MLLATLSLTSINEWILIAIVFVILTICYHVGFTIGNNKAKIKDKSHLGLISSLQGGLMGMLGILLGFSISMSSQRFETRKQLIIDESLNIGTAYFRMGLIPDTSLRKDVRELLSKYLNERIEYYKSEDLTEMKESEDLQVLIWFMSARIGVDNPTINTSLIVQSLNSMIDITGSITGAMRNNVPNLILLLLVLVASITLISIGYTHGFSSDMNLFIAMAINLIICGLLLLIIDMDRPTAGLLRIDLSNLYDLKAEIERYRR